MHVCIAWMFVERIYGSILLCYVHSIDDFSYRWLGQNLDCSIDDFSYLWLGQNLDC